MFCSNCGQKTIKKSDNIKTDNSNDIKIKLEPKDGNKHVLLVEEILFGNSKKIGETYNEKINKIIKKIQDEGYEIIDIKLSLAHIHGYETLIIYK